MPFSTSSSAAETTSATPLADYFWIAGVDGSEILDTFRKLGDEYRIASSTTAPGPAVTDIIEEDADAEDAHDHFDGLLSRSSSVIGPRGSFQRLSFRSEDADQNANGNANGTHSNRSSMTIKGGGNGSAASPRASQFLGLEEFDFDKALVKFASERETFLSDLSLSAGAITPASRPRSRLRTQKIVSEEPQQSGLLRSSIGSVRRHMSFRDMNSMKRQPSVARQGEFLRRDRPGVKQANNIQRRFEPQDASATTIL
jgi:hypothetical protein